jgi:hypothetical protein
MVKIRATELRETLPNFAWLAGGLRCSVTKLRVDRRTL